MSAVRSLPPKSPISPGDSRDHRIFPMAFKCYQVTSAGHRCWQLNAPEPLLLSGRHGLIARHVLANRDRAGTPWQLTPADLLRLVEPPRAADCWIIFEQAEATELLLSRLER